MRNTRALATLVVVSLILIGCSDSAPTAPSSTTVTAEQLAGTWTLVSIQPAGQSAQAAPVGATYTLTFTEGRLSTRVDCNTCSGSFALSGQTVTAGPALACTRAACPTMAFENVYTGLLGGDSTATVTGSTLMLSSARGTLRFTR